MIKIVYQNAGTMPSAQIMVNSTIEEFQQFNTSANILSYIQRVAKLSSQTTIL